MVLFKRAIVRFPGSNFADGLTTVDLGAPNLPQATQQHTQYCNALRECGLDLTVLEPDLRHPDSTFVEDTAVLTPEVAVFCRPGAKSRQGEVAAIRPAVERFYFSTFSIEAPGTVDGGDICEAGSHFFIGLSHRTNHEGARQLATCLNALGYTASTIDIRSMTSILHLKSGISYIGENTMVVMEEMASNLQFSRFDRVTVSAEESYAANCVRVNERVLVAEGYPRLAEQIERRGFRPLTLNMSEFRKMDGGLSCLSLRF